MKNILLFCVIGLTFSCHSPTNVTSNVVTSDIDLFWNAYNQIVQEQDTLKQIEIIESQYIQKGSIGLSKIIEARGYKAKEFIDLINKHPKYWNSIRTNTFKSKILSEKLGEGIEKLRSLYPKLKPAKIYFTVGAMRTNGTTRDSFVLIGSELAMADSKTDISEFKGRTKEWLETFFSSNPIDGLVLLNVHEYVHTQQNPIPSNLLHQVLYEGVAEFVSVKAMGVPSDAPAIEYGKGNPAVKLKFEDEMFYERTYDWMWSNFVNEFEIRDLGYYIGYAMAENFYNKSEDSLDAIRELIEIDYSDSESVDLFIDNTGFFSKPITELRKLDILRRPSVTRIKQFENGSTNVDPTINEITVVFSEKLNGVQTGVDLGDLGRDAFPKVSDRLWSEDAKSWTLKVKLEPEQRYQIIIGNNFRTDFDIPLLPYLIDFKTGK